MTTVEVLKEKNGCYRRLLCMGHADYARKHLFYREPDILCAAISALVTSAVNSLEELAGEKFSVVTNEETGFMRFDFSDDLQDKSIFLLDSLVYSLEKLSEQYGTKYLQVHIKEV